MLSLADGFEKLISESLKSYKLDPFHYSSSPGLSCDVMLKKDQNFFIEKGWTGGISYICKWFSEGNNKYLKNYDPTKENKFIMFLDENNLYGWGMSQPLPYCEFKWFRNIDKLDVNSV